MKITPGPAAVALKALRKRIKWGLPRMGKELGMATSTYQHYEDRYKGQTLPREFLDQVRVIFLKAGIPEDDLAVLGKIADKDEAVQSAVVDELQQLRAEVAGLRADLAAILGKRKP